MENFVLPNFPINHTEIIPKSGEAFDNSIITTSFLSKFIDSKFTDLYYISGQSSLVDSNNTININKPTVLIIEDETLRHYIINVTSKSDLIIFTKNTFVMCTVNYLLPVTATPSLNDNKEPKSDNSISLYITIVVLILFLIYKLVTKE